MPQTKDTTKHTPGPWGVSETKRVVPKEFRGRMWREIDMLPKSGCRHLSAVIVFGGGLSPDEQRLDADARLIAAAPDLLVSLKAVLPLAQFALKAAPTHPDNGKLADALDAIAKAEGLAN